jgi:hypothetical protein
MLGALRDGLGEPQLADIFDRSAQVAVKIMRDQER